MHTIFSKFANNKVWKVSEDGYQPSIHLIYCVFLSCFQRFLFVFKEPVVIFRVHGWVCSDVTADDELSVERWRRVWPEAGERQDSDAKDACLWKPISVRVKYLALSSTHGLFVTYGWSLLWQFASETYWRHSARWCQISGHVTCQSRWWPTRL